MNAPLAQTSTAGNNMPFVTLHQFQGHYSIEVKEQIVFITNRRQLNQHIKAASDSSFSNQHLLKNKTLHRTDFKQHSIIVLNYPNLSSSNIFSVETITLTANKTMVLAGTLFQPLEQNEQPGNPYLILQTDKAIENPRGSSLKIVFRHTKQIQCKQLHSPQDISKILQQIIELGHPIEKEETLFIFVQSIAALKGKEYARSIIEVISSEELKKIALDRLE